MFAAVEIACAAVLVLHWLTAGTPLLARVRQSLAIAAGAFIGEELCIRTEGAYHYAAGWHVSVDRVPLAVLCIWPSVVLSALALARAFVPKPRPWLRALAAGGIVWVDAAFIEPVATHAHLWSWALPGPFGVSWIGPFGWASYGFAAAYLLESGELGALPSVAAFVAQVLILAAYWGLARWLPAPGPSGWAWGLVPAALAVPLAAVLRRRARLPVPEVAPRALAAAIFFWLLVCGPSGEPSGPLFALVGLTAVAYLLLLPGPSR